MLKKILYILLLAFFGIAGYWLGVRAEKTPCITKNTNQVFLRTSPTANLPLSPDTSLVRNPFILPTEPPKDTLPKTSLNYQPHDGWDTYMDSVYKFSFQFASVPVQPYNFRQKVGRSTAGKSVEILTCNTPPGKDEVCMSGFFVTMYTNYTGGSRRVWLSENIPGYENCPRYFADLSVAGKNALVATSDCSSFGETYIIVPNGSQMIVFQSAGYIRDNSTGKLTIPDWLGNVLQTLNFN